MTALIESISQGKLIEPIVLRRMGDGRLVLVSGAHRLKAHQQLGRERILARILVLSDLEAELIELDENLVRIELTALERGEHLLRRKQIYEELHPEVKHGGAPGKSGGGKRAKDATVAPFAEDTSEKTGLSVRTVQDDVKIARLIDGAKDAIRGTPIEDQKRVLLQLTQIDPDKQTAIASELVGGRCRTVAQAAIALGVNSARLSRSQRGDIEMRVDEIARPLREARKRWERLVPDLDLVSAAEANTIGDEISAIERKIAALTGAVKHAVHEGSQDGPRADVPAAVEAALELLRIVTSDGKEKSAGVGREEIEEGEALARPLAEMKAAIVRAGEQRTRRPRARQRPDVVPDFVTALSSMLREDTSLAREHAGVLRAWEVFEKARSYLRKVEPAIEHAYNEHGAARAYDATSATICTVVDRFIQHGYAFVEGQYTFIRYLEDQGVSPALFRKASEAFVQEATEGLRASLSPERVSRVVNDLGSGGAVSRLPVESPIVKSSLRWPITGPLDEPAFNEAREFARGCVSIMERGCEALADMYRDRDVPPHVQEIWDITIQRAERCRPLLDGTWTHADHLHACGVDPTTGDALRAMESGKAMESSKKRKRASQPEAAVLSTGAEKDPIPAEVSNELGEIFAHYFDNGTRRQAEHKIKSMGWSAQVQDAALEQFWSMAGHEEPTAPGS